MSDRYADDEETDAGSVWIRSLPAWHASFALLLMLCAALMFLVAPVGRAAACAAVMAALGLAYAVFGVAAARERDQFNRWAYLGLAAVACLSATWLVPSAGVLLFVLYPQSWLLAERERDGVLATLMLTAAAPSILVGGAFSLTLGIFILRLIDQSRDRAVLLERLTSTQQELGSGTPRSRRRRGAGAPRGRDPRHARAGFHQHRDAGRGGDRPAGGPRPQRPAPADRPHGEGQPRGGAVPSGCVQPGPAAGFGSRRCRTTRRGPLPGGDRCRGRGGGDRG